VIGGEVVQMNEIQVSIGQFENSFAQLPDSFFKRLNPTPVRSPTLLAFNRELAVELGLDTGGLSPDELAQVFSGNILPKGTKPLAAAYAGHQFGNFVPQLGDGRAILMGEVRDRAGQLRDLQLKGSGPTPFSRRGDGRAALGPVLREYLISEAMHALGIPTTRALAAVLTGEEVLREGYKPGGVITRIAASHVRVGSFEYFAARDDISAIKQLADYVIDRHYPEAREAERPALDLLQRVIERQATLISGWMMVGFIHGVMNTDNMTLSGETIDFGPCAFMEAYDPRTVFSSIDQFGRYAYGRQPGIAQWNLARLAEALVPLIDPDEQKAVELASAAISDFAPIYHEAWLSGMRSKFGLVTEEEGDRALISDFLDGLERLSIDFTLAFRRLSDTQTKSGLDPFHNLVRHDALMMEWLNTYRARTARESSTPESRTERMLRVNPIYIPRNHQVEAALSAAVDHRDLEPFNRLHTILAHPFAEVPGLQAFAEPAGPSDKVFQTFCGT
jgi:uncharacterized protein YdiU (UPF0061 family)